MRRRPTSGQTVTLPVELAHELDGLLTLLKHRFSAPNLPASLVYDIDQAVGELRVLLAATDRP